MHFSWSNCLKKQTIYNNTITVSAFKFNLAHHNHWAQWESFQAQILFAFWVLIYDMGNDDEMKETYKK